MAFSGAHFKFSLAFLFFLALPLWAGRKLPFRTYTAEDGLFQSIVLDILQDSQGYLWVASPAGVSRFDGLSFTNYAKEEGLPHSVVRCLYQDKKGTVWAGTEAGFAYFDGLRFIKAENAGEPFRLPVRNITEWDGELVLGTRRGIFIHRAGVLVPLVIPGFEGVDVRSLAVGPMNMLWVGTNSGVVYGKEDQWRRLEVDGTIFNYQIGRLWFDRTGRLWLGTTANGFFRFAEGELAVLVRENGFSNASITNFYQDKDGDIWVSSRGHGVVRLTPGGPRFYNRETGLPSNSVYSVLQDTERGFWFATYGGGLSRLRNENFFNYVAQDGFRDPNVYSICQDRNGNYWFGTNDAGASVLKNGEFIAYSTADGLAHDKVMTLLARENGEIWFGTLLGLSIYNNGTFRSYFKEDGLPHNMIIDLLQAANGDIWIATYRGVGRYREGRFSLMQGESPNGEPVDQIRFNCIMQRRNGEIWFGSDAGIFRLEGDSLQSIRMPEGWQDPFVQHLHEDPNERVWIATDDGLLRLWNGEYRLFTKADGLATNQCKSLASDQQGTLWIGTIRGVHRFDGTNFSVYTAKDGLASLEMNRGAVFLDQTGNLLFGTNRGVTLFNDSARIEPNMSEPPIYITGVKVNNQAVNHRQNLLLDNNENNLEFTYAGVSFTAPEETLYQVKLEGYDDNWQLRRSREVQYTSLEAGAYNFKVRARNSDGVWSSSPAGFQFRIIPPVWQRGWFLLVIVLAFIGITVLMTTARIRRERLKAEAASAIAASQAKSAFLANMSHELRTPLNAIIGYSELLEEDFRENGHTIYEPDMAKIQFAAKQLLSLVNNVLDLSKVEAGKMAVFVESFNTTELLESVRITAEPMVVRRGNTMTLKVGEGAEVCVADKAKLRQILLNLVGNAAKFTEDGTISVEAALDRGERGRDWFRFMVRDTGIGMTKEQMEKLFSEYIQAEISIAGKYGGTGLGLVLCRRFAQMLGGRISVDSELQKGSTFTVTIPADLREGRYREGDQITEGLN